MWLNISRQLTSDSIPIAWSSSRRWNSRKKAQKTQKKKNEKPGEAFVRYQLYRNAGQPQRFSNRASLALLFAFFAPFCGYSCLSTALIPRLRFFRGQMLLELLYLRSDYQLAISLSGILGEIVLMVVFRRIEAF